MKHVMLRSITLFLGFFSSCLGDFVEINSFGESQIESIEPEFRSVTFENGYFNQSISIYWSDSSKAGKGVHMFDLFPSGSSNMQTTDGHSFFATLLGDESKRLLPYLITIRQSLDHYRFGPSSPQGQRKRIHPSVKIIGQRTEAMAAKFRCLVPSADYYYEDGRGGSFQGNLPLRRESTTNTYEGHVFFFTETGNKAKEYARFTMSKDQVLYIITDPDHPAPQDMLDLAAKEAAFMEDYLKRTGIQWRHYFGSNGPRPPPVLHMWPADAIGDVHKVATPHGYWSCDGPARDCQRSHLDLELEVVSDKPRVFIIENFLSAFEADKIISYADPQMRESTVGQSDAGGVRKSDTRTSRNAWVGRDTSPITETLFRRAADVLNLDEKLLYRSRNAEDMQVVHYVNGQRYDSHHDWGVRGAPESRLITLLLYLTDMPDPRAGGETAFPKGAGGQGFKVAPKKGHAVLFYNLLEDGNGDDLALHAALPVHHGEKWLANFWVWDPQMRD